MGEEGRGGLLRAALAALGRGEYIWASRNEHPSPPPTHCSYLRLHAGLQMILHRRAHYCWQAACRRSIW